MRDYSVILSLPYGTVFNKRRKTLRLKEYKSCVFKIREFKMREFFLGFTISDLSFLEFRISDFSLWDLRFVICDLLIKDL